MLLSEENLKAAEAFLCGVDDTKLYTVISSAKTPDQVKVARMYLLRYERMHLLRAGLLPPAIESACRELILMSVNAGISMLDQKAFDLSRRVSVSVSGASLH